MARLSDVLARCARVHAIAGGYMARCPAHPDRTPSLSIREIAGRVSLHCFAGCPESAVWHALQLAQPAWEPMRRLSDEELRDVRRVLTQSAQLAYTQKLRRGREWCRGRLAGLARDLARTVDVARRHASRLGDTDDAFLLLEAAAEAERILWLVDDELGQ